MRNLKKTLALKEAEILKLKKEVSIDYLTGLSSRRFFLDKLNKKINEINFAKEHPERRKEAAKSLALLFIDVDNFKKIYDTFGHKAGDLVLQEIAKTIKNSVRLEDLCTRWGGEEILVVLNNADQEIAFKKAEEIRQKIASLSIKIGEAIINPTISIGISTLKKDKTSQELIRKADLAMYESKKQGKDQTTIFSEKLEKNN